MITKILSALKLRNTISERITFDSLELRNNKKIWEFLKEYKSAIGGQLAEVISLAESKKAQELEFAGGTITVPAGLNCDFNLYNHFKEYFQVDYKIPMFLYHSRSGVETEIYMSVLDDYEVFRKTFISNDAPQVITYFTFGPNLCWGRHSRWRAQFDIFNSNKSTAVTNHACHSWNKSEKVYCDLDGNSQDTQTIVVSGEAKVGSLADIPLCTSVLELKQKKRQFKLSNGNAFNFIKNKNGQLSGNHVVSSYKRRTKLKLDQFEELKNFKEQDIIYNPYVLPFNNANIEFGLWWPLRDDEVKLNYKIDNDIRDITLTPDNNLLFRSQLSNSNKDMIIWQKYPNEPEETFNLNQPMLVARNKFSNDTDFTEFQSCWRNQGFESKIFPHWLGNFKAMKPSSRLTGVINFNLFDTGELILQAVSPRGGFNLTGDLEVNVFDRSGSQIENIEMIVENGKCFHFSFDKEKYGSDIAALRIRSTNVDFTGNLVQWNQNGATSLQHLWGY